MSTTTRKLTRPVGRLQSQRSELLLGGLHLAVLSSLAIAQPLFDLLGNNAEFFAVRGSTAGDIILFALVLVLAPPCVLLALEVMAAPLDPRLRTGLHLVFVACLAALIALPILKRTGSDSSGLLVPLALLAGLAAALLYVRAQPARTFLTVLGPIPVVFLAFFLFFSSTGELVIGGDAKAQTADVSAGAPVVMMIFDELPLTSLLAADGQIDATRYPNFARLAGDSSWFRNTATVDTQTTVAVPAILTGRRPRKRTLPVFENHQDNIFTLLGGKYRLNVDESITRLCPRELCREKQQDFDTRIESLARDSTVVSLHLLLPDDLRGDLPSIDSGWQNFRGGPNLEGSREGANLTAAQLEAQIQRLGPDQNRREVVDRFARSLRPPGQRPTLSFSHLLLPHGPWQYLPNGDIYGQGERLVGLKNERWSSTTAAETAYQRHLLQLGYLDRQLGKLLDRLRATGAYDKSLIAIVSDHGISFRAGEQRRAINPANPETASDLMPVPFFVKAPGQRRARCKNRSRCSVPRGGFRAAFC